MISYDSLSTLTTKVGSYLWNLDMAFWNFEPLDGLVGLMVKLMTGSGTCILWHLTTFFMSPGVRV
jgi:hypothetical protein